MARNQISDPVPFRFQAVRQSQIPKGREGKHKQFISLLLDELHRVKPGLALKIPLAALPAQRQISALLSIVKRTKRG